MNEMSQNCSKEYAHSIAENFWEDEWNKIKNIDFPKLRENEITYDDCIKEFNQLVNVNKNNKTKSKIIPFFHKSMIYARKNNKLSPYDFWKKLQNDPQKFRKFYENRLMYSDWYKKDNYNNYQYLERGIVPEFVYGVGISASGMSGLVTYFKPSLAKNLISRYLNEFSCIFDPCSGYSGRMLGTLSLGKKYIGTDINDNTINESEKIYDFLNDNFNVNECVLSIEDSTKSFGQYDCLFTCPPYAKTEIWQNSKHDYVVSKMNCDQWIELCLDNYNCKKYLFVVDETCKKFNNYIKEKIINISHFSENEELVICIER